MKQMVTVPAPLTAFAQGLPLGPRSNMALDMESWPRIVD